MVPIDDFLVTDKTTNEQVPTTLSEPIDGSGIRSYDVLFTFSYSIIEYNTLRLSDITLNLRTFSGDVFKTKIYGRSKGSSGDFEMLHEGTIESPQTLIDPFSVDGFLNTATFILKVL